VSDLLHVLLPEDVAVGQLLSLLALSSVLGIVLFLILVSSIGVFCSLSLCPCCCLLVELGELREEALVSDHWLELLGLGVDPGFDALELRLRPVVPQVKLKVQLAGIGRASARVLLNQVVDFVGVPQALEVDAGEGLRALAAVPALGEGVAALLEVGVLGGHVELKLLLRRHELLPAGSVHDCLLKFLVPLLHVCLEEVGRSVWHSGLACLPGDRKLLLLGGILEPQSLNPRHVEQLEVVLPTAQDWLAHA
jgi:hypothetical protein